jgi:alpha-L-fucosidase
MKFVILTVKHEAGFCLWDCLGYDYDVAASSVRTNVVAQFIRACNIEGIKPGVHYSVPDSHNEGHITFKGPVSPIYFSLIKRHTTELHKRYPGIFIHYFDVANRFSPAQKRELYQLIKKLNPNCIVSIGLIEKEGENFYIPKMGIRTLVNGWFWTADAQMLPVQKAYNQFCDTIESGANYVLNVAPDKTGQIPSKQIATLMRLKKEIDRFIQSGL